MVKAIFVTHQLCMSSNAIKVGILADLHICCWVCKVECGSLSGKMVLVVSAGFERLARQFNFVHCNLPELYKPWDIHIYDVADDTSMSLHLSCGR